MLLCCWYNFTLRTRASTLSSAPKKEKQEKDADVPEEEETEENKKQTNHLPSPRRKRRPVGKEAGRRWPSRSRKKRDIIAVFRPQDTHIFAAYLEKQQKPDYNKRKWQGACLDTGAQRTVIGLPQARAYCRYMGCRLTLAKSRTVFRFGVGVSKSRGILHMRIPTPNESFMLLAVDDVDADIPFLVGLDILDLFQLNVDTVQNQLRAPKAGWSIPLVRKNGHIYLEWKPEDRILFTKAELTRLHRGFFHPPSSQLIKLIQRASETILMPKQGKYLMISLSRAKHAKG
jgi:Aspartyl protease